MQTLIVLKYLPCKKEGESQSRIKVRDSVGLLFKQQKN
jgi:hypothetical protein